MLGFVNVVSAKGLALLEVFRILSEPPYNPRRQPLSRVHLTEPTIAPRARNGVANHWVPCVSMLPQKFRGLVGLICLLYL